MSRVNHQDLGQLNGPIVLFGGPYSNLQALDALFDRARALGVGPDRMICTGDVVAYCADAHAVSDRMQDSGIAVVAGNCEKQLAAGAMDCGCGFEDGSACDLLSVGWYGYASAQITQAQRDWMGQVPDILSFHHAGKRYAVIHGGHHDIARFIWPVSPEAVFDAEWQAVERSIGPVDGIIAGHCGVAFERQTARGMWINAGVIGMPPNDGAPQTRFAVLDAGQVSFHRLDYDHAAAARAMVQAGLTQGYHKALETGHWPSEDVLPPELRRPALASG